MASEPKSSWGTVLCGCLPWTGQPSSPDESAHQLDEITPRPDTIVPQTDDTVPHTVEAAPSRDQPVLQPVEGAASADEAKAHPVTPSPDEVMPGSGGAAPITTVAGASGGPTTKDNAALGVMKLAMGGLHEALGVFPPLKIAVGGLLECITQLQIADQNRQEYEQLISRLADLASRLQKHLSDSKPTYMPYSIENVARAIEEQVRHIQQRQGRSGSRRLAAAREDEDDILRCYRRVEGLFQQLQTDISLSIWDVVREEQIEARLRRLSPAKDARYNSALSADMTKRRACTANTRTKVLADAHTWTRDDEAANIYWMNGMAGTGKTTIAYSLCERLEEEKQLGASFFCSRDSPTCREVTNLVPTIAYQLARYSNPYRQAVCDVLNRDPDVVDKNIKIQFENLIAKPLGGVNNAIPEDVVVVIDALDECADVNGTKQVLNLLFRHATNLPIKFFVTSRPEPGIATKMAQENSDSRLILHLHDIEQSLVQADIRAYLTEALAPIHPSADHIEHLTARAGRLFIFAATVVRYISPDDESANHKQRLSTMLKATPKPGDRTYEDIDELYKLIVSEVLVKGKSRVDETNMRRLALWTVVCAREPMTRSALAELLGFESEQEVELAIKPLRSVLHVSESTGVVSTLHASFPEFLLSEERAGSSLYCIEAEHNAYLATRCFETMEGSLRFNICQLETSYRFDKDIPNIQTRVDDGISMGLFYACQYWGDHLLSAATPNILAPHIVEFLRHRLLFWMEVLSLKGWIGHGEGILSKALNWLTTNEASSELTQFTHDARNFVTTFAVNPCSLSTPHIYLSVLPFTSTQSHVRMNYLPRARGLLRVEGTRMEARGSAALATWNVGSAIMSLAQSENGKHVVSGSMDGTVSIWDVSKGTRTVGPLQSGEGWDWDSASEFLCYGPYVTFSCDGTRIASGSKDCMIRIWDARHGSLITDPLAGHQGPVLSIAFSPDGALLASGSEDHTIRMWDGRTGALMSKTFEGHQGGVTSVAFSSDSKRVVSGSTDNAIRVWDVHSGATIVGPLEGHSNRVNSVAFSPDGQCIASGSHDDTFRVWDAHSGLLLAGPIEGHTREVVSIAFSPDGMRVVSGSWDCTIRMWDARNGALLAAPLEGNGTFVNSVLFLTDGTRILSGSDDGTICVWDARHGTTAAARSSGHREAIYSVAFSPDGTRAVSGSANRIRVWDTRDGRLVVGPLEGHSDEVRSVAFSPGSAQIASGSDDHTIRTWDARSGALIAGPFEGHTYSVRSVAYSPDGSHIVSGSVDRTIRVWDSQTGKLAADPFMGHTNAVMSVAWSPDGTCTVSGSLDKTVRMWNARDGAALWISDAHSYAVNCVAYSPDGTRVISGSDDRTILVLNSHDGTVLHGPFKGDRDTGFIWSVAFSPDGTRIVSGSGDRTVCVWDAEKGTLVSGPFKGHTGYGAPSVAFSPNGTRIVSCSNDCTIRFWEVATAGKPRPVYPDKCTLHEDGWVTDSDSQLLMWLPPDLRPALPPPCSLTIAPQGVISADYSALLVGERWKECYCESATRTAP